VRTYKLVLESDWAMKRVIKKERSKKKSKKPQGIPGGGAQFEGKEGTEGRAASLPKGIITPTRGSDAI